MGLLKLPFDRKILIEFKASQVIKLDQVFDRIETRRNEVLKSCAQDHNISSNVLIVPRKSVSDRELILAVGLLNIKDPSLGKKSHAVTLIVDVLELIELVVEFLKICRRVPV